MFQCILIYNIHLLVINFLSTVPTGVNMTVLHIILSYYLTMSHVYWRDTVTRLIAIVMVHQFMSDMTA